MSFPMSKKTKQRAKNSLLRSQKKRENSPLTKEKDNDNYKAAKP
jgi:hypothetical protein